MIQQLARKVSTRVGRDKKVIRAARPIYEKTLNILTLRLGIQWSINGIPCRVDARCRGAMSQLYDPEAVDFLRRTIRPGWVCYDVGANLGVYAIQFSHMGGPAGSVVAFEPNVHTLPLLRHHVAINRLSNVHIVEAAAGDAPGSADFYAQTWSGMSRMGAPNEALGDTEHVTVPVITVDDQVERTGLIPNLMLIDVEGFEIAVLDGARETIARHRPVVLVEMHPDVWSSARTDRNRAASLLRDLGLRAIPFLPSNDPLTDHCLAILKPQ